MTATRTEPRERRTTRFGRSDAYDQYASTDTPSASLDTIFVIRAPESTLCGRSALKSFAFGRHLIEPQSDQLSTVTVQYLNPWFRAKLGANARACIFVQEDSGNFFPHVMLLFGDQGSKDFPSGKSRKGRGKPAQGPRTNPTGREKREKGPRTNAETAIFQNGSGSDVQNGSGFVQIHIKRPRTKG